MSEFANKRTLGASIAEILMSSAVTMAIYEAFKMAREGSLEKMEAAVVETKRLSPEISYCLKVDSNYNLNYYKVKKILRIYCSKVCFFF